MEKSEYLPDSDGDSVTKLTLKDSSVSFISIPRAPASKGDLPVRYRLGSYPMTDKLAESLPGLIPSGTVRHVPIIPFDAKSSIQGSRAASRGVLPPKLSIGSSADPSGTTIKNLIFLITPSLVLSVFLLELFHEIYERVYALHRHSVVDAGSHAAYRPVSSQVHKSGFFRFGYEFLV